MINAKKKAQRSAPAMPTREERMAPLLSVALSGCLLRVIARHVAEGRTGRRLADVIQDAAEKELEHEEWMAKVRRAVGHVF